MKSKGLGEGEAESVKMGQSQSMSFGWGARRDPVGFGRPLLGCRDGKAAEGVEWTVMRLVLASQYYNIKVKLVWLAFPFKGEKQSGDAIEIRRNSKEKTVKGKTKKMNSFLLIVQ